MPEGWKFRDRSGGGVVDGNKVHWRVEQAAGEKGQKIRFDLTPPDSTTGQQFQLALNYRFEGQDQTTTVKAPIVTIDGKPVAMINGSTKAQLKGKPGSTIVLSSDGSHGSREDDVLSYEWRQVAGPTATTSRTDAAELTVNLQEKGGVLVFELVVGNGRSESAPARAEIRVQEKGGGSMGSLLAAVLPIVICLRRRQRAR